ncbi:MAG: FHA domain-containing protein [Thermoflexales bacterium]|nr:FHA domain-containing protein [Thermoflexales bacterium]
MATCPECGTVHMPNARTCRKCGAELSRAAVAPADQPAPAGQPESTSEGTLGEPVMTLIVIGPGQRIRLQGPGEFTLGRTDPEEEIYVTVDLSDYDAWESGVSRRHARIYTAEGRFWLEDAQSANGTFLNEEYLAPGQFRPLQAGDLIKLGILRLYVESVR